VRPTWLKSAAPELLEGLDKLEDDVAEDRERRDSGKADGDSEPPGIGVDRPAGRRPLI
jgi:hypothetical protein